MLGHDLAGDAVQQRFLDQPDNGLAKAFVLQMRDFPCKDRNESVNCRQLTKLYQEKVEMSMG